MITWAASRFVPSQFLVLYIQIPQFANISGTRGTSKTSLLIIANTGLAPLKDSILEPARLGV